MAPASAGAVARLASTRRKSSFCPVIVTARRRLLAMTPLPPPVPPSAPVPPQVVVNVTQRRGCGRGCLISVLVFVAIVVALALLGALVGDDDEDAHANIKTAHVLEGADQAAADAMGRLLG